jgi:TetR/AcrR family transcriptional repressor of nem operon
MTVRTTRGDASAIRRQRDTADRILDIAEELVQVRGFNAVSYADVAGELGITKASVHYHFPGKADLGRALITRYAERFAQALAQIDLETEKAAVKLAAYTDLYRDALRGRRMCLCGMLAAEYQTLPNSVREAVVMFFDENESWLERVLEQGRANGHLTFDASARDTARTIISGFEGAMLVARPYGDLGRFQTTTATLLASLTTATAG